MDVYLMRHPARESGKGRCIGQTDVALSEEGRASLAGLVQKVDDLKLTRVVSSDLQRCRVLAAEIAQRQGLTVEESSAWRELNFGAWENRMWDEIQANDSNNLAAWMRNYVNVAPPDGESFHDLQTRTLAALHQLKRMVGDTILVTTHAGVIRSLLSAVADLPLERIFEVDVPYGSLARLTWRESKWALASKLILIRNSVQEDIR